jgi:hypothetical protein
VDEVFLDGTSPSEVAPVDAGAPSVEDAGVFDAAVDDEARESRTGALPETLPNPPDAGREAASPPPF